MKIRVLALTMVLIMMLSLVGCGAAASSAAPESAPASQSAQSAASGSEAALDENGTHTVVDHAGNSVEVPNKIDRIVIDQIPILSTYMAYFQGEAPNIVGFCGSFKDTISKTVLKNIAPELMETADTVYAQSDLNIEEIIKLEPDVILYNAQNKKHAEILQASGIPSIGFATIAHETEADPLVRYKQWLDLLEDVFGEEGKMDAFEAAGDVIVEDVKARISAIPEEDRPSAMVLYKYIDGVPHAAGKGVFGYYWMENLGVKNVAAEADGFTKISMEQIYKWNPEVLFMNGPGLLSVRSQDVLDNTVEGADFSSVQAVKDGRVYGTTLGMWNWFTPNPDAPLVLAWLACKTYPDAFADYPLEDTIRDYYSQWYGYEVTDAEMAEMLQY